MSGRATLSVLGALLVLSVALPASADKEQAAARFREAQAAYDAGNYDTAARAFERAYSAEPHAAALYNAISERTGGIEVAVVSPRHSRRRPVHG